jgi:nucleotide-binding universal stress UspA family protein
MRTETGRDRPAGLFRRVLVGFDGSTEAQRALLVAVTLASEVGGQVHVLLVARPPAHAETEGEAMRAVESERESLSRGLSEVESRSPHRASVTTAVVLADDPAPAIAAYAEEHGYDLVVVGTHGREHSTHRGIGRSVEALLRHHPCPVLVV